MAEAKPAPETGVIVQHFEPLILLASPSAFGALLKRAELEVEVVEHGTGRRLSCVLEKSMVGYRP